MAFATDDLQVVGLAFDIVGVGLLALDLVASQRSSRDRATAINEHLAALNTGYGGVGAWTDELGKSGTWEQLEFSEGIARGLPNTFDAERARDDYEQAVHALNSVNERVVATEKLIKNVADEVAKTASESRVISYFGSLLVIIGFGFQIMAIMGET